jgi:hypothetical protein
VVSVHPGDVDPTLSQLQTGKGGTERNRNKGRRTKEGDEGHSYIGGKEERKESTGGNISIDR